MKKQWSTPKLESLNSKYTKESGMIAYYEDLSTGLSGSKGMIGIRCVGIYNLATNSLTPCGKIFSTADEYITHVNVEHPGSTMRIWEDVFIS